MKEYCTDRLEEKERLQLRWSIKRPPNVITGYNLHFVKNNNHGTSQKLKPSRKNPPPKKHKKKPCYCGAALHPTGQSRYYDSMLPKQQARKHYLNLLTEVHTEHFGIALGPFDSVKTFPGGRRLLCRRVLGRAERGPWGPQTSPRPIQIGGGSSPWRSSATWSCQSRSRLPPCYRSASGALWAGPRWTVAPLSRQNMHLVWLWRNKTKLHQLCNTKINKCIQGWKWLFFFEEHFGWSKTLRSNVFAGGPWSKGF